MSPLTRTFALITLVLSLAACSSLTPPPVEQPTAIATATVAVATLAPNVPSTQSSTAEVYELEGAATTPSGLQFLEVKAGVGAVPEAGDLISLHFTGALPDGTNFADTRERPGPVYLVYGQDELMPGLDEGLGMMKAGGQARMALPPGLAFGEQGYGIVPPNSPVIFDVELFTVEKPPQPASISQGDLKKTDSGLQYADLIIGQGADVKSNDTIATKYWIWVKNDSGNQYITSSLGNDPLSFVEGAGDTVFPGWEEGMLGMKVGGKRLLVIPPELALGETGGGNIPPNATLVMEVEVVDVTELPTMTIVPEKDYIMTSSGLKYYDIQVGEGESPTTGQTVIVHYTGWLEDGTQFDSSVVTGTPFSFKLGTASVIQGWDEGVATMKVGGKRQLKIPADLAYGDTGAGSVIPPGATLIFDVELLDIQP